MCGFPVYNASDCIRSNFLGVGILLKGQKEEQWDCIRSNFLGVGICAKAQEEGMFDCIRSNFLGVGIRRSSPLMVFKIVSGLIS